MKRFFFDVAMQSSVHYDYSGKDFATTEEARELAELIALDIECTAENNMTAFEVQVRNVTGDSLFKVPALPGGGVNPPRPTGTPLFRRPCPR